MDDFPTPPSPVSSVRGDISSARPASELTSFLNSAIHQFTGTRLQYSDTAASHFTHRPSPPETTSTSFI